MKKIYILYALLISLVCYSQNTLKEFYVVAKAGSSVEPLSKSTNSNGQLNLTFEQPHLNNFFIDKNVQQYEKAFPTAKSALLQRTYFVAISDSSTLDEATLKNIFNLDGERVEYVKELEKGGLLHEPDDYTYGGQPLSHLDLIRAPLAWEITKGDPNILIGISDNPIDTNHEELITKVIQNYGTSSSWIWSHGTLVSTAAAGATNNGLGIASIGYNTKLITHSGSVPYTSGSSIDNKMRQLLELSQQLGVKVVNGSWWVSCAPNVVDSLVVKEIWDNGVLPVFAAGNGGECNGPTNYLYPQAYGNSIVVTSIGHTHDHGIPFTGPTDLSPRDEHIFYNKKKGHADTHHHYDKVDLSAPGYQVVVGAGGNNYTPLSGTSLASPIVAGAAALVFALRPDFTPTQVKNILKSTADDIYWIPGNEQFQGLLGTGRLNAFRALKMHSEH